jgi:hypothetical protein
MPVKSLQWVNMMQGSETIIGLFKAQTLLLARFFTPAITLFTSLISGMLSVFLTRDDNLRLLKIRVHSRIERLPNGQQNAHRFVPPRRNKGGRHTW